MRKIKIPFISKIIISLFSIVYSALALLVGTVLAVWIPPTISKMIGVSILLAMGIWLIIQSCRKPKTKQAPNPDPLPRVTQDKETLFLFAIKSWGITIQVVRDPMEVDMDRSGIIDPKEALLLGLALSVDAIGAGIGSAMAGFSGIIVPFFIGFFQIVFLYLGSCLGEIVVTWPVNEKVLTFTPGILLILLAILRLH